jgi:hypothetical protein
LDGSLSPSRSALHLPTTVLSLEGIDDSVCHSSTDLVALYRNGEFHMSLP